MRAICPAFGPDNGPIEVSVLWCALNRGLPPSAVARERLLAMIREDQGPEADMSTVLVDVADQLRAVATRMNPNAVGA
jgi:hypothetical protein